MTQDVGQAPLPWRRDAHAKGNYMYIGLGTILLIILVFFLFRAFSGRRV
jgi:hypothetical protein